MSGTNPAKRRSLIEAAQSRRSWFGPVAILCGVLWAVHGWIGMMNPSYWAASSTVDYASVVSFSAALVALAACIWYLRVIRTRAVTVGGAAAAGGLLIAGIANIIEDGFGVRAFVVAYIPGVLIGTFALIPMGVGLARGARPRWIALAPLASFPGLIFQSQWYGTAVLVTTWIAVGALHSVGILPLTREVGHERNRGDG